MSDLLEAADKTVSAVAVVDSPEALSSIAGAGCAAAIWGREPSPSFQSWIDGLEPSQLPSMRAILRPGAVREAVGRQCETAGAPDGPERARLIDDISALAHSFVQIMRAPYLRVRLDVVTTNACRKFHIDAVAARLICTYRGAGTQYGFSENGAEPGRIFTVPTGAPIVLRGALWPENPPSGLLHRSPPIAGTGETRLLLVLDPIHELEADGH